MLHDSYQGKNDIFGPNPVENPGACGTREDHENDMLVMNRTAICISGGAVHQARDKKEDSQNGLAPWIK
jgi:hypothetical protein